MPSSTLGEGASIPGGAARRVEPLSSFLSFPTMGMGVRLGQQQWEGCSSPAHASGYSPISSPGQRCQHMPVSAGTCAGPSHSQPWLSWSSVSCPSDPQGREQLWLWAHGEQPAISGSRPRQPHHQGCMSPQEKGQSPWHRWGLHLALCLQDWGGTQPRCSGVLGHGLASPGGVRGKAGT